jgi:hypothetical protein
MKYALFFILSIIAFSVSVQTVVYALDSIVSADGGKLNYKRTIVSIEPVEDTAFIAARRLEIERQISGLQNELLTLNEMQAQFEDIMGGMSIMSGDRSAKPAPVRPAKKTKAPATKPKKAATKPKRQ